MDAGQRKLLPYEYQLIDALGITKDEYLDFVQYQGIYRDVKQDTSLDVRNWTTVAIVMTVVGALMTTASVIMTASAKKGQQEAISGAGQSGRRAPKFAPRNGFNSQQPLAVYGDPVNLIYANKEIHTDHGGVRASGSLVWSAVRSFGNSQFVEMLMVLGGGKIGAIDEKLCAFGQTPLRDLIAQNYWIYFGPGQTGVLKNANQLPDDNGKAKDNPGDPAKVGNPGSNPYRVSFGDGTKQDNNAINHFGSISIMKNQQIHLMRAH